MNVTKTLNIFGSVAKIMQGVYNRCNEVLQDFKDRSVRYDSL